MYIFHLPSLTVVGLDFLQNLFIMTTMTKSMMTVVTVTVKVTTKPVMQKQIL